MPTLPSINIDQKHLFLDTGNFFFHELSILSLIHNRESFSIHNTSIPSSRPQSNSKLATLEYLLGGSTLPPHPGKFPNWDTNKGFVSPHMLGQNQYSLQLGVVKKKSWMHISLNFELYLFTFSLPHKDWSLCLRQPHLIIRAHSSISEDKRR